MKPDLSFLKSGVPAKLQVDALMEAGKQYRLTSLITQIRPRSRCRSRRGWRQHQV
jgi:hypothetical protein